MFLNDSKEDVGEGTFEFCTSASKLVASPARCAGLFLFTMTSNGGIIAQSYGFYHNNDICGII